jgi:hypothetical protein
MAFWAIKASAAGMGFSGNNRLSGLDYVVFLGYY